jgi:hypothetical protein
MPDIPDSIVGESLVPSRVTNTDIRVIRPGGHKTLPYVICGETRQIMPFSALYSPLRLSIDRAAW